MCACVGERERGGGGGEEGDVVAYGARTISQADRQTGRQHAQEKEEETCLFLRRRQVDGYFRAAVEAAVLVSHWWPPLLCTGSGLPLRTAVAGRAESRFQRSRHLVL